MMRKIFSGLFASLYLFFLLPELYCTEFDVAPVVLSSDTQRFSLGGAFEVYYGTEEELSWDRIRSAFYRGEGELVPYDDQVFGRKEGPIWLGFKIENQSLRSQWVLSMPFNKMGEVDLFLVKPETMYFYQRGILRYNRQFREAGMWHDSDPFVFILDIPPGESVECFVRLKSITSLSFATDLRTMDDYYRETRLAQFFWGVMIGFLVILFCGVLLFYLGYRKRIFLYYGFFLLSMIAINLNNGGFFLRAFFEDCPDYFYRVIHLTSCLEGVTFLLFTGSFFKVFNRESCGLLKKIFYTGISLFIILCAFVLLMKNRFVYYSVGILQILGMLATVSLAIYKLRESKKSAVYYLLAFGPLWVGALLEMILSLGVFPGGARFQSHIFQLGSVLNAFFLTLAVADHMRSDSLLRRTVQEQLLDSHRREVESLRMANNYKESFLSAASHELRTPLNGILGLADHLKQTCDGLNDEERQDLGLIVSSAQCLSHMITDILDYTKMKGEEILLDASDVSLQQVIESVRRTINPIYQMRDVRMVNHIPGFFPRIRGDESRLIQIFYNLTESLLRARSRVGIVVTAETDGREAFVTLKFDDPEGRALEFIYQVPEDDPFAHSVSGDMQFARLSHVVAHRLIEMHGGRLYGAEGGYRIALPLSESEVAVDMSLVGATDFAVFRDAHEDSGSSTDLDSHLLADTPAVVAVVEDDTVNQLVIRHVFENAGYSVRTYGEGSEFFKDLDQGHVPNLVLLDMMLPNMSGIEVCREVRKTYSPGELPVILLTAGDRSRSLLKGFKAGINDFLSKPFNQPELLIRAKNLIHLSFLIDRERERQKEIFQMDKLMTLGTVASGLAHEINNPNNSIKINATLLDQARPSVNAVLREHYEAHGDFQVGKFKYSRYSQMEERLYQGILGGSDRIQNCVEDLRRFIRNDTTSQHAEVDLNEVVRKALRLIDSLINKKTNCFRADLDSKLPSIYGTPHHLEQLVVNLVQNSCQALTSTDQEVSVSTRREESWISLIVSDQGSGMDPETVMRCQSPFFSTKKEAGGMGLGLYIVAQIVKGNSAELLIDSELGEGTRMEVRFPFNQEEK